MLENRFNLGAKNQPAAGLRVIQRFNSEAVTRQQELSIAFIPQGKSKHPAQMLNALLTELLIEMDDYFRVARGRQNMPPAFQLSSQQLVIINFAVEDSHDGPVFVADWLLPSIQIDDAKPPHSHRKVSLQKRAGIIRAPVVQDLEHVVQNVLVHRPLGFVFVNTANSAHGLVPGLSVGFACGHKETGPCLMRGPTAVISQDLLVNLNDSLCYSWSGQMLYPLAPSRPVSVTKDINEMIGEPLSVRFTNVTPVGAADDFADIPDIGGDDR